jgi:AcrR family transcriptional regulator
VLFEERGFAATGVDAIAAHAGVRSASLYRAVGSKDALIVAVLERWSQRWQQRITAGLATRPKGGRGRLLQLWDVLAEWFAAEDFRGSLIANAAVELRARPEHPAHQVVAAHRAWVQQLLERLAAAGGLEDPLTAAERLHLLVEGAIVRAAGGSPTPRRPTVARWRPRCWPQALSSLGASPLRRARRAAHGSGWLGTLR